MSGMKPSAGVSSRIGGSTGAAAWGAAVLAMLGVPASASMLVVGEGQARACYESAEGGHPEASAVRTCTEALMHEDLNSRDRVATLVNRGVVKQLLGDAEGAVADYSRAKQLNADLADIYVNEGIALVRLERDREALQSFNRALELKPSRPHIAYYGRAFANELLGNVPQAYEDFRTAERLAPEWHAPKEQLRRFTVKTAEG